MTAAGETDIGDAGWRWRRGLLGASELSALGAVLEHSGTPGIRLAVGDLRKAPRAFETIVATVRALLPGAEPVRAVAFDKSSSTNWSLPWHQDRVIAVKRRHNLAGFRNWTIKHGIPHCEPPPSVLSRMLFARIHLDDATEDNGALELSAGSHRLGLINAGAALATAESRPRELCTASAGDVLMAHALILHRSSPSRTSATRRALRIDFSADLLPPPLAWSD